MLTFLFNFIQRIRRLTIWLWSQEGTPGQRARGIALGVFSGCFPFFGLQTLIGIMLAKVFKGNILLAAAGTWISNPFTYVPLFWLNYKIGELFLGVGVNIDSLSKLSRQQFFDQGFIFSSRILLGSSVLGSFLAISFGSIFYILFKRVYIKTSI